MRLLWVLMLLTFLLEGKSNRLVAYRDGKFVDYDIDEALAMTKDINDYEFNISALLSK